MKPIAKLYAKAVISGFLVGFAMMIPDMVGGIELKIELFILISFIHALAFIIIVTKHKNKLIEKGIKHPSEKQLSVNQNLRINSKLGQQKFVEVLLRDEYFSKMKLKELGNTLKLKSTGNWKMWVGELITIKINQISDGEYNYDIGSKPRIIGTLVDYGKNLENVERIKSIIENDA